MGLKYKRPFDAKKKQNPFKLTERIELKTLYKEHLSQDLSEFSHSTEKVVLKFRLILKGHLQIYV